MGQNSQVSFKLKNVSVGVIYVKLFMLNLFFKFIKISKNDTTILSLVYLHLRKRFSVSVY